MLYLKTEQLPILFELVKKYYSRNEEVPTYGNFTEAISKLSSVLDGVQNNLYLSISHKIAYLFLQINKGHFFPNGNKRLALVVAVVFAMINNYQLKELTRDEYQYLTQRLFPKYNRFQNFNFFPEEFGLYNLSIIVADSHLYMSDFSELKKAAEAFFEFALVKVPEKIKI
jgi:prophage maintenance system killer protein